MIIPPVDVPLQVILVMELVAVIEAVGSVTVNVNTCLQSLLSVIVTE